MRIFAYEIGKILKNKVCCGILFSIIGLNIFLLYENQMASSSYTPGEYKKIYQDIERLTPQDAITYLQKQKEKMEVYAVLADNTSGEEVPFGYEEQFQEYYQSYEEEKETLNMNSIISRRMATDDILKEVTNIANYEQYLKNIQNEEEKMSSISIFQKGEDSFSQRNIQKTANDFQNIKTLYYPKMDNSKGVELAVGNFSAVILELMATFLFCYYLFLSEKQKGILLLIRTSKNGRKKLVTAKMMALVLCNTLFLAFIYLSNILTAINLYGLGDLDRSIQTVYQFYNCGWNLTVMQFLILNFGMKILVGNGVLLALFACFTFFRTVYVVYIGCFVIYGVGWYLYTFISPGSALQSLRYLNLFYLMQTYKILGNYLNVNLLGFPISGWICFLIFTALITAFAGFAGTIGFCRKDSELVERIKKGRKREHKCRIRQSLWAQEIYKLLIANKAILFLIILLMIQIYYLNTQKPFLTIQDVQYETYMKDFSGTAGKEREELLTEEMKKFDHIQNEMQELEAEYQKGNLSKNTYFIKMMGLQQKIEPQQTLQKIIERNQELGEMNRKKPPELIFEKKFDLLTNNLFGDAEKALKLVLFMILGTTAYLAADYEKKVVFLQKTCLLGREKLFGNKIKAGIVYTVIAVLLIYLPDLWITQHYFGLENLGAPIYSLKQFSQIPFGISIFQYLCIVFAVRVAVAIGIFLLIFMVTQICKRAVISVIANTLLWGVPILIYELNITGGLPISVIPICSVNFFFYGVAGWYFLFPIILILAETVWVIREKRRR